MKVFPMDEIDMSNADLTPSQAAVMVSADDGGDIATVIVTPAADGTISVRVERQDDTVPVFIELP